MSFPTSPTNNQTATVNGISYTYSSATNAWTRTVNANVYVTIAQTTGLATQDFANSAFNKANTAATTGKAIAMAIVFGG